MSLKKKIIIDIRSEEEILEKRLISYSDDTILMFIPVSHIKFNKEMIRVLSKTNTIYIICKKAKRSTYIKKTFFLNDHNIISINGGINQLEKMHNLMKGLKVIVYKVRFLGQRKFIFNINKNNIIGIFIIMVLIYYFKK